MVNKEYMKEYMRKWRKENPESDRAIHNKYRHTEKGIKAAMEAQRRYRAKKKIQNISKTSEEDYLYDSYIDSQLEENYKNFEN